MIVHLLSFIILEICSASHQSFLVVFYRNIYVLFCAYDITVWHMASVIRPLTGFLRGQIKGSSIFSFIIVTKALFLSSYIIVTTSLFPISSFTIVTTISVPYFLLSSKYKKLNLTKFQQSDRWKFCQIQEKVTPRIILKNKIHRVKMASALCTRFLKFALLAAFYNFFVLAWK